MTNERLKQAQDAVNILDTVAARAPLTRQDHVNVQGASQFLHKLLVDETENSKPAEEALPANVIPLPAK